MKKLLLSLVALLGFTAAQATDYVKLADASLLKAGDTFIVVGATQKDNKNYAMGVYSTGNNCPAVEITLSEDGTTVTDPAEGVAVITLEAGEASGKFALSTTAGYLYAASSSSNQLKAKAQATDWTISIGEGAKATLTSAAQSSRNILRYNNSGNSNLFSCYTSGQQDVYIFRVDDGTEPEEGYVATPVASKASGTYNAPFELTLSCATEGAQIMYAIMSTAAAEEEGDGDDNMGVGMPEYQMYTEPITIDNPCMVFACALDADDNQSEWLELEYEFQTLAPVITPASGRFAELPEVTITCATEGAVIYYTIDGSEPTNASTVYAEPFTPAASCAVKAVAIKGVWAASEIAEANYSLKDASQSTVYFAAPGFDTADLEGDIVVLENGCAVSDFESNKSSKSAETSLGFKTFESDDASIDFQQGENKDYFPTAWVASGAYNGQIRFYASNKFVITPAAGKKIVAVEFKANQGNAGKPMTCGSEEVTFSGNGSSAVWEGEATEALTFVVTSATGTGQLNYIAVSTVASSGIEGVEAENVAAPVYYNLQGVRVNNPERGIFIEVRGNKAVKVMK